MRIMDHIILLVTLGWRNIWRQKKRSYLVMAAASVGMLGVLLTVSLMNGLAKIWVDGAIESGLGHVQIRPKDYSKTRKNKMLFKDPTKTIQLIRNIKNKQDQLLDSQLTKIDSSIRFERAGLLRLAVKVQGVNILGVEPRSEKNISSFDEWIIRGEYFSGTNSQDELYGIIPCVLGLANAKKFEIDLGDTIVLSIGNKEGSPGSVRLRVQGIFQSIAEPLEKYTVLILREDLSKLFDNTSDHFSYAIYLAQDRRSADHLKEKIVNVSKNLELDVMTYKELQPGVTRLLELSDAFMLIFYMILLLGFAFVLLNSVLMSVFERVREIGIVRAIGSSGSLVFSMVILESFFLSLIGSVMGILLASGMISILSQTGVSLSAFSKGMEMMGGAGTMIYPSLYFSDIWTGLNVSLSICLVASLYPAIKAVKLLPIKAIYSR